MLGQVRTSKSINSTRKDLLKPYDDEDSHFKIVFSQEKSPEHCFSHWYSVFFDKDSVVAGGVIFVEFMYQPNPIKLSRGIYNRAPDFNGFVVDRVMLDYELEGKGLEPYQNCDTSCISLKKRKLMYLPITGRKEIKDHN